MKRDESFARMLEAVTYSLASYAALPTYTRQQVRLMIWRLLEYVAYGVAYRLGRLGLWAENRYRVEVAGVS